MDFSKLVLLSSPIFFHLICFSFAQPDLRYVWCSNIGNYSINSTYETNLNPLLSSLPSNTSINGFLNFSVGEDPDKASAVALCRADVTSDVCRSCVNDTVHKLPQSCPNRMEAFGGYDECMVRYSNRSIIGVVDTSIWLYLWNPMNISSSDQTRFDGVVGDLMYELRARAASGGSIRKFASGAANVTSFQRIYGLVQCTPDMGELSCSNCLDGAILRIPNCCAGKRGGRAVSPSCNLRFESELFYTPDEIAPPPGAPPPVTNATTDPTTGGRK